ncbi:MBL fold metallo-hydrolase [Nannocystis pusilla]|uniref:MBL fold metallo-hydrolase n=1 Tax=Nannocystis pusilla TaxID=889268 RepID=A0A9X3F8X7_9BACT|nr:MBL fold metallo-hydrolase [Nannocystis pusilla]MCY1013938.1 MBL fold metallo-hydrolase [Nannocystis pusilla]
MALVHLPTGLTRRSAGFAYRGGAFSDRREFTMSAALVRHPRGDILIDTGFGRDIDAHFGQMPLYFRATTRYEAATPAADQLDAAGYAPERLRGILLTHAHWDHVSGVPGFPGTPVLVPAEERAFIAEGGSLTAVARVRGGPLRGIPLRRRALPRLPREPRSVRRRRDRGGAGLRSHARVGDRVRHAAGRAPLRLSRRSGVAARGHHRAGRAAWPLRTLADADAEGVRENLLRVAAIAARFPEIMLVPAHDARARGAASAVRASREICFCPRDSGLGTSPVLAIGVARKTSALRIEGMCGVDVSV